MELILNSSFSFFALLCIYLFFIILFLQSGLDKIFNWTPYDMIWWNSELDHCSSHFKNFKSKECIVVHTYV